MSVGTMNAYCDDDKRETGRSWQPESIDVPMIHNDRDSRTMVSSLLGCQSYWIVSNPRVNRENTRHVPC